MNKFYALFAPFLILVLSMFLFSCNESTVDPELYGSISGTVKTSDGSIPMEGVTITTSPGTSSFTTNAEGVFEIGEVAVGDYSITAKKEDYTTENINISVREDQEVVMEILMQVAPLDSSIPDEITYVSPLDIEEDETKLSTEVTLTWNNGVTEKGDTLYFDVILFEGADDTEGSKYAENILDTTFTVKGLKFETTYLWKIEAKNKQLETTEGKLWRFTTEDYPLNGYLFVKDSLDSRDIYSWDLQENHLVRLTDDGGNELYPRISPNEQKIAYSSNSSGKYHIYTMSTRGKDEYKVTGDKDIVGNYNNGGGFTWSPSGDQILYGHYDELLVINADGTGLNKIANAPVNREFIQMDWTYQFNNDSNPTIVALSQGKKPYDNEIYLIDPDDGSMTLLVDNIEGTLSNPHFSNGGDKIIFSMDTLYEDDRGYQNDARIISINIDGTGWQDLSGDNKEAGTNDLQARYSELGGKIIFMNVANDGEGVKSIWTMDTDGSNREKLINNGEMPDWYNP
nr:carboxypeptidase regulatory-like domain-containing protein [uncultured Marinifilum sp.]